MPLLPRRLSEAELALVEQREHNRELERIKRPYERRAVKIEGTAFLTHVALSTTESLHLQAAHAAERCPTGSFARSAQRILDTHAGIVATEMIKASMES